MLADVLMCWNKQELERLIFVRKQIKKDMNFLFKNKKGQRKKKHVQRGTGEKKNYFRR
jgi:hypothetical protein